VMSVNPGFGGQSFIEYVLPKIAAIRRRIDANGKAIDLEVEASHARVAGLYQRHGFRAHTRARWVLPLR